MLRNVRTVLIVICVSAIAVVLVYPLLGLLFGDAFVFLLPGFFIGERLPESATPAWLQWLLSCDDPGPACGAGAAFILSFLFWWPLFSLLGSFYVLRKRRAKIGA
jgi:hypothetical protein